MHKGGDKGKSGKDGKGKSNKDKDHEKPKCAICWSNAHTTEKCWYNAKGKGKGEDHGKQHQRNVNNVNDDATSTLSAGPSASQVGSQASTMPASPGVRTVMDQPRETKDDPLNPLQHLAALGQAWMARAARGQGVRGAWQAKPSAKPCHARSGERCVFTSHYLGVEEGEMEADRAPQELEASPEPSCAFCWHCGLGSDVVRTKSRGDGACVAKQDLYSVVDDTRLRSREECRPFLNVGSREHRQDVTVTFQVVEGITDNILSVNRAVDAGGTVVCFHLMGASSNGPMEVNRQGKQFILRYASSVASPQGESRSLLC